MSTSTDMGAVIQRAKDRFALNRKGIHGFAHWQRVHENGIRLAKRTKADKETVALFAFVHDCCREYDSSDPEHGPRAADFAVLLRDEGLIVMPDKTFDDLFIAVRDHTHGRHASNPTIATCWDADRLDIGRVSSKPLERYLSTAAAKDPKTIAWAYKRSRQA